ncbi:hypothetical protein R1sor_002084 [Riccia sorocarpa]|uniref:Uncharacterized protein n=1 Tax=Riccia sorocarpa TaxID=122646 RepID=A0ABD3GXS4_9MARC
MKRLVVGIKNRNVERTPDKNRTPDGIKKLDTTIIKLVTERAWKRELKKPNGSFTVMNVQPKPVVDNPSNRTKGAKQKTMEPSDSEGAPRRRKLQLEQDETEETTEEREETSGKTLGSDPELSASTNLGDEIGNLTPPYKQDDSTPESEKVRKKFDAGEMQRADHMLDDVMEYLVDPEPIGEMQAPSSSQSRPVLIQPSIKEKQVGEPTMVKLDQHFGNMSNPLRPWEVMGSEAQIPSLHINEILRGDIGNQPPSRSMGVLKQVQRSMEQRRRGTEKHGVEKKCSRGAHQ